MDIDEEEISDQEQAEYHEQLIVAVRKNSILYDCTTNSCRNKQLREATWTQIAKEIKKPDAWCKLEWSKLRTAYKRKKKTLKGKTGQARLKIQSWSHFQALQFLDDHEVVASTSGNLSAAQQLGSPESVTSHRSDDTGGEEDTSGERDSEVVTDEGVNNSGAVKDTTYSYNRNPRSSSAAVDAEIVKFLKKPRQQEDEHHYFGMAIAEQLRKSTPEMASCAKIKIQQILHEHRFPIVSLNIENAN